MRNPRLKKSTAFTAAEHDALGLVGLLPEGIESEETQIQADHATARLQIHGLGKYIYLSALQDNDETLYYKVLMSDPAHFMLLVYTGVGLATFCQGKKDGRMG